MSSQILLDSYFRRNASTQTGGDHRHAQIHDLLRTIDPDVAYTDSVTPAQGRVRGMFRAIRSLMPAVRPAGFWPFNKAAWIGYGFSGKIWESLEHSLRLHPGANCLVNDIQSRWAVPYFCRAHRLPWIATPHNLDVLWKGKDVILNQSFWKGMRFETDLLRMAAHVFTISHEEQFLLANLRIRVDCLPYYPPADQVTWLESIRAQRSGTGRENYVVFIANFLNESSAHGLRDCLARFLPPAAKRPRFVLVGWKSEPMANDLPGVEFAGGVSREKLAELFAGAKAMVVHQTYGGGALTRIPEALIAGMPVIANTFAARSAMTYQGVYTYDTPERLAELLNSNLPTPPVPPRPVEAERRFRTVVEEIISERSA